MFKGNKKYIFFLVICFSLLILLQVLSPKPINWNLSYSSDDKNPYGAYELRNQLKNIFPSKKLEDTETPLYNTLHNNTYTHTNYIIINQIFNPDKLDTKELLKFAEQGNNVFIAANFFTGNFADTLKLNTQNFWGIENYDTTGNVNNFTGAFFQKDTARFYFVSKHLNPNKQYVYSKGIENTYFSNFDTSRTTILGKNSLSNNGINFIKIKWQKGNIFISTAPEVFSNYHFVSNNHDYVYTCLSYLPNQAVIWDEYYKVGNVIEQNPFRVLFNNEALLAAYYLTLLGLLIFMIIGIKRKQRIIPVLESFENTTLQFVDVVGTLYYQTGNHKNIADKKINYFLDYIRTNFQVKTNLYDDTFISRISNLSGINRDEVHKLFYYFADINIKTSITENELIKLNQLIEIFYKENKR